jgi:hypothetical protein
LPAAFQSRHPFLKIRDIIPHLIDLRFEILLPLLKLADPIL